LPFLPGWAPFGGVDSEWEWDVNPVITWEDDASDRRDRRAISARIRCSSSLIGLLGGEGGTGSSGDAIQRMLRLLERTRARIDGGVFRFALDPPQRLL
jgi:hypothetical protein